MSPGLRPQDTGLMTWRYLLEGIEVTSGPREKTVDLILLGPLLCFDLLCSALICSALICFALIWICSAQPSLCYMNKLEHIT